MMSCLGLWRKAPLRWWRTRGFGIHSPFAFGFVNEIARERYGYYAYPAIDRTCRYVDRRLRENQDGDLPCRRLSAAGARCLFRIAARLGADAVFSVGHTNGKGEMAMRLARRDMRVVVVGDSPSPVMNEIVAGSGGAITLCPDLETVAGQFKAVDCRRPMMVVNNIAPGVDIHRVNELAGDVLARRGVVVVRNLHSDSGCRQLESRIGTMMNECGAQFAGRHATVFVGFQHLQPQRFLINLPF